MTMSGSRQTGSLEPHPMEGCREVRSLVGSVESVASQEPGMGHTVPLGPWAHASPTRLQKDARFLLLCP